MPTLWAEAPPECLGMGEGSSQYKTAARLCLLSEASEGVFQSCLSQATSRVLYGD